MACFEVLTKCRKFRWQSPVEKHLGVVQVRWLAIKDRKVMKRIENHLAFAITTIMLGDDATAADNLDAIYIRFDDHCRNTVSTRNTVAIAFPGNGLILVDLT
jgi:hypothetical protein